MSSALEAAPAEASTPVAGDSTPAAASSSAEQAASPSAAAEEAQMAQTQQMQSATLSRQASQSSQQAQHPQMAALRKIDALGEKLQKEGKLLEALQCLEKSLILRGHIFGLDSVEVFRACRSVGELCNWLAMSFLQQDLFDVTLELLKKAEVLTERHKAVRAVTFNNLACYYRKRGKLRTALNYGRKALGIEAKLDEGVKSADTHLNLCTILSELKRHEKAMVHARIALKLLLMELFGDFDQLAQEAEQQQQQQQQHSEAPEDTHEAIATGELQPSPSSASLAELRSKLPPDRVAVLAIAYHNLAVQQEFLRRYSEALVSYEKALRVVRTHLGPDHPLVASLGESYAAAKEKLEGKMARQAQRDAAKQAAAARQQGTGSSRPTASSSAASLHSSPSKLQLHAARSARSLHVQAQAMALPEEQEAAAAPAEEEQQVQEEEAAEASLEVEEEAPAEVEEEAAAPADGAEPAEVAEALPSEVEA